MDEVIVLAGQTSIYDALPHARTTDPATSHEAAARLTDKHTMMRTLLLVFAAHDGLSAEEACRMAGYGPADGGWKRVSDLKNLGWILPTGNTTTSSQNRRVAVLAITAEGREQLASS